MKLTPELINRLVTLKSLLELGDVELATVASSRLETDLDNLIEYTLPAKPNSRLQKYRLTEKRRSHLH